MIILLPEMLEPNRCSFNLITTIVCSIRNRARELKKKNVKENEGDGRLEIYKNKRSR